MENKKQHILIHEKYYDLEKIKSSHPGGYLKIFEALGNEKDCTALFESSHCMKDINKIYEMMKSYEISPEHYHEFGITDKVIKEKETVPKFNFDNYHKLTAEIKEDFISKDNINKKPEGYKANTLWYFKVSMLCVIYILFYYNGILRNNDCHIFFGIGKYFCAFLAGIFLVNIGFCVMHDGSHYGLFNTHEKIKFPDFLNLLQLKIINKNYNSQNDNKESKNINKDDVIYLNKNDFLNHIFQGWGLWNSYIWYKHHEYAHHSFTGIFGLDPDLIHLRPLARKTKMDNKVGRFLIKIQEKTIFLILFFLPGMYLGQAIGYFIGALRGHIWKVSIKEVFQKTPAFEMMLYLLSLSILIFNQNYLCVYLYFVGKNIMYAICIIPDHDLYESLVENEDLKTNDWCEMQIRKSGNFIESSRLFTELNGGINYQIEHHLFPTVAHCHYPLISKKVKNYCKKNNIPYVTKPNWKAVYESYLKTIWYASAQ